MSSPPQVCSSDVTSDVAVNTAVSAAWAVANKSVESVRPTAESKLKGNIDKIQGAQDSVSEKVRGAVGGVVDPACAKFMGKVLEPVLPKATGPVRA